MHRLVPDFILQQYGSGRRNGNFPATTLFVDVSGFSAITDMLIESGSQHGAEVLAGVMRTVFDPLVTAVYDQGGFIVGFAGDAFMAVFPKAEGRRRKAETGDTPSSFSPQPSSFRALAAAWAIQQHMAASADHDTPYGRFTLSTKVGMALGEVAWGIVTSASGNRASYYFQGTAVDRCAAAEHLAQAREVVADAEVHAALAGRIAAEAVGDFYRITSITGVLPSPQSVNWGASDPALVAAFFPETVTQTARTGEFRQVVNLFVGLPTVRTAAQVDIFMQIVFALQDRYGGLLNRLDFGDKGAHLLLFWGAPVAFENDVQRALNFVLDLQTQTAIPIKVGMTYRRAHAGHIGSPRHEEYTCYGRGVNLAARFMMAAPRGEIWVDEYVARRASGQFNLDFEGKMAFKGFARQQKVYVLFERREQAETYYEGELVGREAELQALTEFVQPIFDGRYAGMLIVWGEPGIGKSRLVHAFQRSELFQNSPVLWAVCQTDEILRESFNPFRYWLKRYFGVSDIVAEARNKRSFNRALDRLITITEDEALSGELERTRSFLGALLGLRWPDSLHEQLDAQGRYENTLIGLTTLLRAESLQQPLVLFIEDGHWLDADSRTLLPRLVRTLTADEQKRYPLAILITARAEEAELPLDDLAYREIYLGRLTRDNLAQLAATHLDGPAAPSLLDLLAQRAEGNPFFAGQILHYLQERSLLAKEDEGWMVAASEGLPLPADVRAVLVARLDRLELVVREAVQTAAVLGREFEVRLLAQMLQQEEASRSGRARLLDVQPLVEQAQQAAIWSPLNELRYLFKHALLRDAAYHMQLHTRLRRLHRLAARAIEQIHGADLSVYYVDLAYHYGQAGEPEEERRYAELAGQQAAARLSYGEAAAFFTQALAQTPQTPSLARYRLLLAREDAWAAQAARDAQAQDLAALAQLATALDDHTVAASARRAEVALRQAEYANAVSNFTLALSTAQRAIALAEMAADLGRQAMGYLHKGRACWLLDEYETALLNLEDAMRLAEMADDQRTAARSLSLIGLIAQRRGDYDGAEAAFSQALALSRAGVDRRGESRTLNYMGNTYRMQDDYDRAYHHYTLSLNVAREIGDRVQEARLLRSIGGIFLARSRYAEAQATYEQGLRLYREVGDRQGEGAMLRNLADTMRAIGLYEPALVQSEHSLSLLREIGDRRGEGLTLESTGSIMVARGRFSEAKRVYKEAMQIYTEIDDRHSQGVIFSKLASVAIHQGNFLAARDLAERALAICRDMRDRWHEANVLCYLGVVAHSLGDYAQAQTQYEAALALAQEIDHRWRTCRVLGLLGLLHHHLGDQAQALAQSDAALNVAEGPGLQDLAGYALKNRGHALAAQEQWPEAAASYERAVAIRQQLDQPHLLLECRVALLHVEARRQPAAVATLREVAETLLRHPLHGLEEPARAVLTLYQLLEPHDREQATAVLAAGYGRLEAQADALSPPLRDQYLTQVAAHRTLVATMANVKRKT